MAVKRKSLPEVPSNTNKIITLPLFVIQFVLITHFQCKIMYRKINLLFLIINCTSTIFGQYPAERNEATIMSPVQFDTAFYKSGAILSITPIKNGAEEGEQRWYEENGEIRAYCNYKNGKLNGPWIEYYPTGYYKAYGWYLNGYRDSTWIENYPNKKMKSLGNYYPDINYLIYRQIDSIEYILKVDSSYQTIDTMVYNSERLGELMKEYGEPSTRSLAFPIEIYFKTGKWQYWNEKGELKKEEIWDKGQLISTSNF